MDYLPVDCFGKVPFHEGFLPPRATYPVTRQLQRWFEDGNLDARRVDPDSDGPELCAGREFLFAPRRSDIWIAGIVGPSQDSINRPHVFSVFTHLPARRYGRVYHLASAALVPVWSALNDTRKQLLERQSREALFASLDASRVPPPGAPPAVKPRYERRLAEGTDGLFDAAAGTDVGALVQGLPAVFQRVKASAQDPVVIQLPVSPDHQSAALDAAFWIELIGRQFRWKSFQPTQFLPPEASHGTRDVLLVYGELEARFYRVVLGKAPHADVLRPAPAIRPPSGPSYPNR